MKIRFSSENRIFNINGTDGTGIPYLSSVMLDELGVPNAYTTRYIYYNEEKGTAKSGIRFKVMPGESEAEAVFAVKANTDRLADSLGSSLLKVCITDQKHTANVYTVRQEDLGFGPVPENRRAVDGLITDVPDAVLMVFGGDCPPVYIADPVRRVIGLVHAGRAGTFAGIPEVAIRRMTEEFGCNVSDLMVVIGPGICGDCYEMGDEIYDELVSLWGREDADRVMHRYPSGRYHLDLRAANLLTLERMGIPGEHISVSNVCTCCNVETFYSYRAGRMENEQVAMMVNRFAGR